MQILAPNRIKLDSNDESVFELIKVIKPTHTGDSCRFFEGPLWIESKRKYNDKLVSRIYHLISHHLYKVSLRNAVDSEHTYLRVSGRGNINTITREEAIEVINTRVGYIEDSELMELPPNDDPEIPYLTATCDF